MVVKIDSVGAILTDFRRRRAQVHTSLREQYVYHRAAKLYAAAFASDPGKSGRSLAAWLRRATPMETETEAVAGSSGSQPPKRAKKSWAEAARAALPAA